VYFVNFRLMLEELRWAATNCRLMVFYLFSDLNKIKKAKAKDFSFTSVFAIN